LRGIHFSVAPQRASEFKRRALAETAGRSERLLEKMGHEFRAVNDALMAEKTR